MSTVSCHSLQLISLPMRKEGFEKPKQIAPRGELFIEEPERRLSLRATILCEESSRFSPPDPHGS